MTSIYAKNADPTPRHVVFVVYPDIVLLDLVGPLQVFSHAKANDTAPPAYQTHVVSLAGGPIETNTILDIPTTSIENWHSAHPNTPIHTLIAIGGDGAPLAARNAAIMNAFTSLVPFARRICSVCSGTFLLAEAGLLDGRRAVTHWEDCAPLAALYPKVSVEEDPIFVKDGHIWTSAGITAGIDMALALITEDLGKPAAIAMARSLVTPIVRSGGQSQFSAELDRQARDTDGSFAALHQWVADNIATKITVDDMAQRCAMSPRNFSRRYTQIMGLPPAKALEAQRVDAARDMLATSDQGIQAVATACGFLDDERMRRAFLRAIKTTPSAYRSQFR